MPWSMVRFPCFGRLLHDTLQYSSLQLHILGPRSRETIAVRRDGSKWTGALGADGLPPAIIVWRAWGDTMLLPEKGWIAVDRRAT